MHHNHYLPFCTLLACLEKMWCPQALHEALKSPSSHLSHPHVHDDKQCTIVCDLVKLPPIPKAPRPSFTLPIAPKPSLTPPLPPFPLTRVIRRHWQAQHRASASSLASWLQMGKLGWFADHVQGVCNFVCSRAPGHPELPQLCAALEMEGSLRPSPAWQQAGWLKRRQHLLFSTAGLANCFHCHHTTHNPSWIIKQPEHWKLGFPLCNRMTKGT